MRFSQGQVPVPGLGPVAVRNPPDGEACSSAGWYLTTVQELVRNTLPPILGPLAFGTAWRYVYAIVMWLEKSDGSITCTYRGKERTANEGRKSICHRCS